MKAFIYGTLFGIWLTCLVIGIYQHFPDWFGVVGLSTIVVPMVVAFIESQLN